jgi:hypothetical protein
MNKQVVTIGDKNYIIDLDRAKFLGLCVENKIESFNVGDVFRSASGLVSILILECNCTIAEDTRYQIAGRNGLETYSEFDEPVTAQEILEYLNDEGYTHVGNINDKVARLIIEL